MSVSASQQGANLRVVESVLDLAEVLDELVVVRLNDVLEQRVLGGVELLGDDGVESLPTPDADVFMTRRLLVASRAGLRGFDVVILLLDVDALHAEELALRLLGEDRDIPARRVGATDPAHAVFEMRLTHAARSEIGRSRLPEVGEIDRFVETVSVTFQAFQGVREVVEGARLRLVELRPQGRVGILRIRMEVEPLSQVGRRRNERNSSLAGLAVDVELQTVVVVADISDGEVAELSGAAPTVPRNGDESTVAWVPGSVDEAFHLVARDHVSGVRCRVVVLRGPRVNPGERAGNLVTIRDVLAEHPEGDAVVAVRLLVFVLLMDPADTVFGSAAVVDGVGDGCVAVTRYNEHMTEELFMPMNTVLRTKQAESVVEVEENVAVSLTDHCSDVLSSTSGGVVDTFAVKEMPRFGGVVDEVSVFDSFAEQFEVLLPFFLFGHSSTFLCRDFNLRFESWRRRSPKHSLPAVFFRQSSGVATRTSKEVVA